MSYCNDCGCEFDDFDLVSNIYGEDLCEDCWEEYINSYRGKAQYIYNIFEDRSCYTSKQDIEFDYDKADLKVMLRSWHDNKSEFALSLKKIARVENYFKSLGYNI